MAQEIQVRFEPGGSHVRVPAGTTLLAAARRLGLPVASACGAEGACGRCGLEILAGSATIGAETEQEKAIKARNRIDAHLRLACRVELVGNVTASAQYW